MGLSIDREKYIEVLSKTAKAVKEFNEDTPIKISLQCIEDILELLKEQEPVKPILSVKDRCYYCGDCEETEVRTNYNYCPQCGKRLKW